MDPERVQRAWKVPSSVPSSAAARMGVRSLGCSEHHPPPDCAEEPVSRGIAMPGAQRGRVWDYLQHLLDVLLPLGLRDPVHVPLEHLDEVSSAGETGGRVCSEKRPPHGGKATPGERAHLYARAPAKWLSMYVSITGLK